VWLSDQSGGYIVRGVYDMLTSQDRPHIHQSLELIWHKQVPLKVTVLAWRLLRDRLPTKDNLASRGIIPMEARLCVTGCSFVEDVTHMFLTCPFFGALWSMVRAWLGVDEVDSHAIPDHFMQFIQYAGGLTARRSFFHLIWLQCVWVLWNERNDRLFRGRNCSLPQQLDKVKSNSLRWLQASNVIFSFGTHTWWSNPFVCMGIDCLCL